MKSSVRWPVRFAALCSMAVLALAVSVEARAEAADDFPSRQITLIVPFAPGGSSDTVMRLVASLVSQDLKQTIVIENRPGGAGNIAALAIKNAPKDGYMLMLGHTGSHAINYTLYPDLKFHPLKDFSQIVPLVAFNNFLNVPAGSPAKSPKELVALAKSKPDGLTYGSQGVGTGGHLLAVLLAKHAGIKLVHVPYRGVAPAVTDMAAGRVDMMFSAYLSARPHVESGKLRMLAIAGAKRHPNFPDIPTMGESGFPDVQMQQWFGLFGPAGIPDPVVRKLNAAFVKALESDSVKNRLMPQGMMAIPGTPEDLKARVARDIVRLGQVVKDSGAKPR